VAGSITVTPAYGRDYRSKAQAIADWEAGKDFILQDITSPWDGKPINKEDAERSGFREVKIRFKQMRQIAVVKMAAAAAMYRDLADAAIATGDERYAGSGTEVWFMKPEVFRDYIMGPEFLREMGEELPTARTIARTHVMVGEVGERNPERVFTMMQGEKWSPRGEARQFIQRLGLRHTSMSVGDCVKIGSKLLMASGLGFEKLGATGKIASPNDLTAEIRRIMAYCDEPNPSRRIIASQLRELAERVK
jgi:hypothetical protein